jgi:hypothetical protein
MKGEPLTKEKIEKIKNYIFSPSEIFKVEDMSIAQKQLNKSDSTGFLINIDTLVPL